MELGTQVLFNDTADVTKNEDELPLPDDTESTVALN